MPRNPNCDLCPLHKTCSHVCLWGEGGKKPTVMFVGEAPGANEDRLGRPFVGRSGKVVRRWIADLGLKESQYFITNAVKCRPPENKTPGKKHLDACRPYLLEQINKLKPKFIVMLGAQAIRGVTGLEKVAVASMRGQRNWYHPSGAKLIATYHPAAVLRNPRLSDAVVDDLNRLAWDDFVPQEKVRWSYVKEVSKLPQVLAFDCETTGLNPFGTGRVLSVAWSADKNRAMVTEDILGFAREARNQGCTLIGHNVKFDLLWLYTETGILLRPGGDTKLMAHLLNENDSTSLKYLGGQLTGYGDWGGEVKAEVYAGKGEELPKESLWEYNAYDAAATWRLFTEFKKQIRKEGVERIYQAHIDTIHYLCEMEAHGMPVDKDALDFLIQDYEEKLKLIERRLQSKIKGFGKINFSSNVQLAGLLFSPDKVGLKPVKKTKGGSPSVDEASLKLLYEQTPLAMTSRKLHNLLDGILELRNTKKVLSTYLLGVKETLEKTDRSTIHPSYNITGTVTGRLSCANPNMQNIPRDSNAPVKQIYVPSEDHIFVQADYSQIELRMGALITGDEEMLETIRSGVDIHDQTATKLFGPKFLKEDRVFAKTINFGVFYGMGPYKLAEMLEISVGEARGFLREWYSHYPGVKDWQKGQQEFLQSHGYVTSIFGRRRRLPTVVHGTKQEYAEAVRQACNFPVQSAAADLTLFALNALSTEFQVLGTVHDSVLLEIHKRVRQQVQYNYIKEIMEDASALCAKHGFEIDISIPTPVDIEYGPRWGSLKEWNQK